MRRRIPVPGVCAHARNRMVERFGRDLTREEWLGAVESITAGRLALLCAMPSGSEHYLHEIGGVRLRLVWVPERGEVVTVLPLEWGASAVVQRAQRGGVRVAMERCEKFRKGERLARRTAWVPPEVR